MLYRIRVILIDGVGTDHSSYFLFIFSDLCLCTTYEQKYYVIILLILYVLISRTLCNRWYYCICWLLYMYITVCVYFVVGLSGFQSKTNAFYWYAASSFFLFHCFHFFLFFYGLVLRDWGLRTDKISIALSRPSIANLYK